MASGRHLRVRLASAYVFFLPKRLRRLLYRAIHKLCHPWHAPRQTRRGALRSIGG
jgi:hypothetical protein